MLLGELLLHCASDEGRLLAQPLQGEFALLVHGVPFPALADDPFVIPEVKPLDHEFGARSLFWRDLVRGNELQ